MPPSPKELLDFLFSTIARKLPPISLRQGASVARYLRASAAAAIGPERDLLDGFSQLIWGITLAHADFKMAEKNEVIEFLERHAQTHLVHFGEATAAAVSALRSSIKEPSTDAWAPRLAGRHMGIALGPRANLADDLTERISAGYWALKFGRIPNARGKVAEALNRHGIQTRARQVDTSWSGYEVAERVKQFDRVLAKRGPDLKKTRRQLVNRWNSSYRPTSR